MASNSDNVGNVTKFPKVQGGGSLILAWQIKNKHVLVVGGGEVSNHRANDQTLIFMKGSMSYNLYLNRSRQAAFSMFSTPMLRSLL